MIYRYWDSDVFLKYLKGEPGADKCERVLAAANDGETVIVTSALTLAEVLWLRSGVRIPKEDAQKVIDAFEHPFIKVRPVDRQIAEDARKYVWGHNVKPKDAIHVATAIHYDVPILETFDKHLISQNGKVGPETQRLVIRQPFAEQQAKLFEDEEE